MVRRLLLLALVLPLLQAAPANGHASVLPSASFEDQDGRQLDLAAMRGRVVVIVYGGRSALAQHVAWGKRLDGDLRERGVYRPDEPPQTRSVQILALAQMGGIPEAFRSMLRAMLRARVESGYSLWLDWDDRMSILFGAHESVSTVVVADQQGVVRLVVSGPPQGAPYRAVSALLRHLR
ncbi:MAG TPA: hypothetical protein VEW68_09105 [Patescibacteria group bacterium]|nr:hypothetical protein [Patescibacteria group bacterium]